MPIRSAPHIVDGTVHRSDAPAHPFRAREHPIHVSWAPHSCTRESASCTYPSVPWKSHPADRPAHRLSPHAAQARGDHQALVHGGARIGRYERRWRVVAITPVDPAITYWN